jgi:hypothetical protein
MAIDFPASPTLNDVFTVGNVTYVWDGTKWTASVTGGISLDKIEEGNTSAEVIDTGSDGRFVVTTEGTERLFVNSNGNISVGSSLNDSVGSTTTLTVDQTSGNGQISLGANGTVRGRIFADNSTGELRIGNPTAGDLMLYTNNTERLRINSAGLVGIGTSSPGSRLEIGGDSSYDATITFNRVPVQPTNDAVIGELFFQNNADSVALIAVKRESAADDAYIQFATQQTTGGLSEKLRITSAGRVGIGTTSPGGPLGVQVDTGKDVTVGLTSGSPMITYRNGSGAWFHVGKHPTSDALIFSNGATTTTSEMARFDNAGRLLVGTSSWQSAIQCRLLMLNK